MEESTARKREHTVKSSRGSRFALLKRINKRRGIVQRSVYGSPKPKIVVQFHVPLPSLSVMNITEYLMLQLQYEKMDY